MAKSNILDEILAHCFTIDENKCLRDALLFTAMVLLHDFPGKIYFDFVFFSVEQSLSELSGKIGMCYFVSGFVAITVFSCNSCSWNTTFDFF